MPDRAVAAPCIHLHLRRLWLAQILGIVLVAALAVGSAESAKTPATAGPQAHVITIENMQFAPAQLTVKAGDRVTWINKDLFAHTATAVTKAFDSGSINASASWTYVAGKPGDYAYVCAFHPTMKGRLSVQ